MSDPGQQSPPPSESDLDIDPEVVADLELGDETEQQVVGGAMCKNANSGASNSPACLADRL